MELSEAIVQTLNEAFAGARPGMFPAVPGADALSPSALLRAIKDTFGVTEGARIAGIDRRTFQRALNRPADKPYKPTSRVLDRLRGAYRPVADQRESERQQRISRARASVYATLTRKGGRLVITGRLVVSGDARKRTLDLSNAFTGRTRRAIVDAYLDNDPEKAADEFNVGLNADYLENPNPRARGGMYVDDVHTMIWR